MFNTFGWKAFQVANLLIVLTQPDLYTCFKYDDFFKFFTIQVHAEEKQLGSLV